MLLVFSYVRVMLLFFVNWLKTYTQKFMGVTKVMIIRHAEKPGTYPPAGSKGLEYNAINPYGQADAESLVTLGWERAGGIANLFYPTNKNFQSPELAAPNVIYAASPYDMKIDPYGNLEEPSQRPYQTISALYGKMQVMTSGTNPSLNLSFKKGDYANMVTSVLALQNAPAVLIAWQHQDILIDPKKEGSSSILNEFFSQTNTSTANFTLPVNPWPGDRYDMVLVLDMAGGQITAFTQVPQMLLANDSTVLFT
ncbi:MAG: hypothetical protein FD123_2682 [Bacteroidetes bacterium]|nr:MAG: hypothetical protein FD123_2682 [Bacteroidota bacterium]